MKKPCTWQEQRDLNTRITESKSVALPLGYAPVLILNFDFNYINIVINCKNHGL